MEQNRELRRVSDDTSDDHDLLLALHRHAVALWIEDGRLCLRPTHRPLRVDELAQLRHREVGLVALLRAEQSSAERGPVRRDFDGPVPLTATQRQWLQFIDEYQGGLGNRMTHVALRFTGRLDRELLRTCLDVVVWRHESLRTRIAVNDGTPMQHIDAPARQALDFVAVKESADAEVRSAVLRLSQKFLAEPVSLARGPLFAAKLFRCGETEHVLVLGLDHMITDSVSNAVLCREIGSLYERGSNGLDVSPEDRPLQYADYAVWQQRGYGAWRGKHEAYWLRHLAGAPRIRLPLADDVGAERGMHPLFAIPLGAPLSERLRELARQERTLPVVAVFALYAITVAHWCKQRDLLIKFVTHARSRPELHGTVGFIASTLYLRLQVHDLDTYIDVLRRAILELRSAYAHQDFDRVPDVVPQCATDLVFNWVQAPARQQPGPRAMGVEPFVIEMPLARRYFSMFSDTPGGIVATVWSRPTGASLVQQLADHLRKFATECAQYPGKAIDSMQ